MMGWKWSYRFLLPLHVVLLIVLFFIMRWPVWNGVASISIVSWGVLTIRGLIKSAVDIPISSRESYLLLILSAAVAGFLMWSGIPSFGWMLPTVLSIILTTHLIVKSTKAQEDKR